LLELPPQAVGIIFARLVGRQERLTILNKPPEKTRENQCQFGENQCQFEFSVRENQCQFEFSVMGKPELTPASARDNGHAPWE